MTTDEHVIETTARKMFEQHSREITGHVWIWDDASEEIRDRWRKKALLRLSPLPHS